MSIIYKIKHLRHEMYIWKYCHKKIQNNKIIFWADNFKHFGCSPKYIALYLLKNYPEKFDLVWVFDESVDIPQDIPHEIRVVKNFSMEYLKELHTAKFVICNMRIGNTHYWHKRADQIYIQTWHSSLRLKKIEGDASLPEQYCQNAKIDSDRIDLLLSGCKFSTDIFRRAFWYNGEILESGTPRCDMLINSKSSIRDKVLSCYNIPEDYKLVLYAPTFRSTNKAEIHGIDFNKLCAALGKRKGDKWKVGCRLHPNIVEELPKNDSISMTKYPDMQELIAAADLLITDYSSCMFDMAIAGKPCILYTPDLENYCRKERGLYFDINQLPFPIAKNMNQLEEIIAEFDVEKYNADLERFMSKIGIYEDGQAAQRVAQYIISHM